MILWMQYFFTIMFTMVVLLLVTLLFFRKLFFVVVFVYIILCLLYLVDCKDNIRTCYDTYPPSSSSVIPSVIYTYWNDATRIPHTVRKCLDSWKKWNPEYTIHMITNDNLASYLPFELSSLRHADQPQRTSDFIRLYLLATHGGIWMDASVYLSRSLDWVHGYQTHTGCEFVGYVLDEHSPRPNVESWFLACVPQSSFLQDWKNQFYKLNEHPTVESYINEVEQTTNLSDLGAKKNYLSVYAASQYLLQKPNQYQLQLLSSLSSMHMFKLSFFFPPAFFAIKQYPVLKWINRNRTAVEQLHLYSLL